MKVSRAILLSVLVFTGWHLGVADGTSRTLEGRVCDVFRDDVDDSFVMFSLNCRNETVFAYCQTNDTSAALVWLEQLIGSDVRVTGPFLTLKRPSLRQHIRHILKVNGPNNISIVSSPMRGPFDVPDIHDDPPAIEDIDKCGPRKVRGSVIARWNDGMFLVKAQGGDILKIQTRDRRLPALNQCVEAVGKVTTDLYHYGLVQARWRHTGQMSTSNAAPEEMPLKELFTRQQRNALRTLSHGKTITVHGTLKGILTDGIGKCRLLLQDGDHHIAIDCSAIPESVSALSDGYELSVTGVCVMDSEYWHSDMNFPKVSGLFLVPRTVGDIRVLRKPSWWTPIRLLVVVFSLLAALAIILVWNASLRVLVIRKSRALLREQVMKLTETLKIDERTRLAAELHDFHCQSLTAVAYQVSAARNALPTDASKAEACLSTAANMLKSCRTELRRCLWDLRNDVLNDTNFANAIRSTVTPISGTAAVNIRFSGSRAQISDMTAHAALCILRELVANAVHHGQAKQIRIAGELLHQTLRLSVKDDGCGFDPAKRPGQDEGHFGLDGISARLERFNGSLEIESRPGAGAYVRITFNPSKTFPA